MHTGLQCIWQASPGTPPQLSGGRAARSTMSAANPTVDELEKKEEELFRTGPLSVLTTSVKTNSQVRALELAPRAHCLATPPP